MSQCRVVRYAGGGGTITHSVKSGAHVGGGRCAYCEADTVATCEFPSGRAVCAVPVCTVHRIRRGGADLCPTQGKPLSL